MPEAQTDTVTAFDQLPLSDAILRAVRDVGYETPSPIQARSIPHLLEGRDLLGLAQTGTGKTAAFALPALSRIDVTKNDTQVLVLCPTRELAIQVAEACQTYAKHIPHFHVLPIYGGQDMRGQLRGLSRGAQVVVGTPGRVMDHLRRNSLKLDNLQTVVLDEADEMLRMGFVEDIEWILDHTPSHRQTALFSATMPPAIRRIADKYLKDPVSVEIRAKTTTVDTITQKVWMASGLHKLDALTRILEVEDFDAMIIFVRTRSATVELAEKLEARGFSAAALNGDMSQGLREKMVDRLKKGTLDILIATDVAARGLDVERISHVVNYDIPNDTEAYVHRIGRTGRAGRQGTAILFAAPRERRMLRAIEHATRQKIEHMRLPTQRDVRDIRIKNFKEQIALILGQEDLTMYREIVTEMIQEQAVEFEDAAAALCYLAQKERPFPDGNEPEPRQWEERERRPRRDDREDPRNKGKKRYRIGVGRDHGVSPGEIVGALANEGGISGRDIGHIRLFDKFSTVYLPETLDQAVLSTMAEINVRNQVLGLREWKENPNSGRGRGDRGGYRGGYRGDRGGEDRPRRRHGNGERRGGYRGNRNDDSRGNE
ncbi:DEAD/DEAH box helicase [Sansalvadorimonas verongulae]|uniref:DEAD/DEAH box helicase n=1 Tax=Sansalvadorimonas verongulae TaxID=2172824 RepID=UPI0012BB5755|nr:DEAD/DEAH box helicase [Sansalvadorimonas verongulae]MTI13878.1 DEAD/DEAH box helicase [Sansalvadorimonas verongulae]